MTDWQGGGAGEGVERSGRGGGSARGQAEAGSGAESSGSRDVDEAGRYAMIRV